MEFVLPLPNINDHLSASRRSWTHLKQRFQEHLITTHQEEPHTGGGEDVPSSSLLMFLSGNKIKNIVKTVSLDIDDKFSKIDEIFKKIEDLCLPNFILLYERFKFFSLSQTKFEDLSKFVLELQILGSYCELHDEEKKYVTDRIVNGVSSEPLKQHKSVKNVELEEELKIRKDVDHSSLDLGKSKTDKEKKCFKDGLVNKNKDVVSSENMGPKKIRLRAGRRKAPKGEMDNMVTRSGSNRKNQISCFGVVATKSLPGHFQRQTRSFVSGCSNQSRKAVKRKKMQPKITITKNIEESHSVDNNLDSNRNMNLLEYSSLHYLRQAKLSGRKTAGLINVRTSNGREIKTNEKEEKESSEFNQIKNNDVDVEIKSENIDNDNSMSEKVNCLICGELFDTDYLLKCHSTIHSSLKLKKCSMCEMTFVHSGSRSRHMRQAHPEVLTLSCDECDMQFWSKMSLDRHKLSHSKVQETLCNICGLKLSTTKEYYLHQRLQHKDTRYACELCGLYFPFPSKLKMHLMTKHNAAKPFMCEICGSSFAEKHLLVYHKYNHTGEKKYECTTCGRRFVLKSILNNHMKIHQDCKPYTCDVCGMSFKLFSYLKGHMKVHTQIKVRPHMCSKCGMAFRKLYELRNHERTHTGEKPYKCNICHRTFSQRASMRSHIRRIHEGLKPKDDKFSCEYCGLSFTHSSRLKLHHMKHTGERPFACKVCGSTYRENHQLRSHMKIHSGNEPFKCPFCPSRYLQKSVFEGHIRKHTGERPFKCPVCSQSFTHKAYLNDHIKVHGEHRERKYKCSICYKAFTCSSHMRSHERLHTGDKPHKCHICGSRFTKMSSVKKHLKRTHGIKDITLIQPLDSMSVQNVDELATGASTQLQVLALPQQITFSHHSTELHGNTKAHELPPEFSLVHTELQVNLPKQLEPVLHSGSNTQVPSQLSSSHIYSDETEVHPGVQPHEYQITNGADSSSLLCATSF